MVVYRRGPGSWAQLSFSGRTAIVWALGFTILSARGEICQAPGFVALGDVPVGSFAADFIEALDNQGITGGRQASPLLYCPGNAVLRQQMAIFLVRTFGR